MLDSDDAWMPTKLERQVRMFCNAGNSITCCLCNAIIVSPQGEEGTTFENAELRPPLGEGIWENVPEVLVTRFVLFNQAAAIRRSLIERIGGFDEDMTFLEDYEFPLRLSLEGPWGYIKEPLVIYHRDSPGSYAALADASGLELRECAVRMRERLWNRVAEDDACLRLRRSFRRELNVSRRLLSAFRFSRNAVWPFAVLGTGVARLDRYRRAAYRRSPWYPQMRVAPIGDSRSASTRIQQLAR
jgi:hypothetical protein